MLLTAFIVGTLVLVIVAVILVLRLNRKDEEQAWRDYSEGGEE